MPDNLPLPPDLIFIKLCPTIAQPPIPPKNPVTVFATPCPMHSRFGWPVVSVKSSIKFSVSKLSMSPTNAITMAYGKTILSISMLRGTSGRWNVGKMPPIGAMSPTVLVSNPKNNTARVPITIATKVEGTARVSFGKK